MEGFTKEVLMMWKVLVVEGGRCIAPKVGKRGIRNIKAALQIFKILHSLLFHLNTTWGFLTRGDRRFEKPGRKEPGRCYC